MSRARPCWLLLLLLVTPGFAAAPPAVPRDGDGDALPPGVVARLGSARWRLADSFHLSTLSPDGRWLVSRERFSIGAEQGRLFIRAASSGRLLGILTRWHREEGSAFHRYAFTSDSKHLLSSDESGRRLYLWDIPSGQLRRTFDGPRREVTALAVARNGTLAAVGDRVGAVHLHDLRTGKYVCSLPGERGVDGLAFTTDGCLSVLASTIKGHYVVRRFDLLLRRELHAFEITGLDDETVALSPDGRYVATATDDQGVRLWHVETGTRRTVRTQYRDGALALSFSHDGHDLVIAGMYRFAWLCDVDRAEIYQRLDLMNMPLGDFVDAVLLSPDGKTLAVNGSGNRLVLCDVRTGRQLQDRPGFAHPPVALRWSGDGRSLVAASRAQLSRWETTTGRRLSQVKVQPSLVDVASLTLAGSGMVVYPVLAPGGDQIACSAARQIHLIDCRTGRDRVLTGHQADLAALAFSLDGKLLASADQKGTVRLWDAAKGQVLRTVPVGEKLRVVRGMAFSVDGRDLALGESRSRVHLLDVRTGKLRASLYATLEKEAAGQPPAGSWAGAFSLDGRLLYTDYRNHFRVWDLGLRRDVVSEKTEQMVHPRELAGLGLASLSLSVDQRFLARLSSEGQMTLVERASGQVVHRFDRCCTTAAFAPGGWRVAGASCDDCSVLIWDLGALFRSLPAPPGARAPARLWEDMASRDAGLAQRALWRLAATPDMEDFLAGQMARGTPARLREMLRDLDSDDFATREKAEQALAKAGEVAQPALEAALAGAVDLELRRRLERLLRPIERDGLLTLRRHRAVLALEARGTPEARRLLRRLAGGEAVARLTQEAQAALQRLQAH
jgi:WD40 repeat protein